MRVRNFTRLHIGESMLDTMGLRGTSGLCIYLVVPDEARDGRNVVLN